MVATAREPREWPLNLRQLRYFAAVARARSFVAASRILHVSQPAIGYQVKLLENSLEVVLFTRHSRGVTLTEPGKKLLHHAEAILDRIRAAEEAIVPFQKKLVGDLSLGVTPTSGRVLSPDILSSCAERTRLHITVHQAMSHELFRQVENRKLDMAFCYEADKAKRSRTVKLYREHLFLVGPPNMLKSGRPVSFDELSQFPLVLDSRFQIIRQRLDRVARQRSVKLNVVFDVEAINLKREMIIRHQRCTVVPYGLFLDDIREKELYARQIINPTLTQSLFVIFRRNLNVALSAFMLSMIKDTVAKKIAEGRLRWEAISE